MPVYSLAAAAGGFSKTQIPEPLGWAKVSIGRPLGKDMFIARVKGRSMEPMILDGSYCVFALDRGGTRKGKTVLVASDHFADPENSAHFTVKKYESEKELLDDGTWKHKKIILSPVNKKFKDIVLESVEPTEFRVVAEFIAVIK